MQRQRGFTAIELMVTVAVAAIALGIAVPSFMDLAARRRVEGVATELNSDLQWARTESVSRVMPVRVIVTSMTQYQVQTTDTTSSTALSTLKTVDLPTGVSIAAADSTAQKATFTPVRAMLLSTETPPTFNITSSSTTAQLRIAMSAMGRPQLCTPGTFTGYKPC